MHHFAKGIPRLGAHLFIGLLVIVKMILHQRKAGRKAAHHRHVGQFLTKLFLGPADDLIPGIHRPAVFALPGGRIGGIVEVTDLDETVSTEDDFNAYGKAITSLSALKRVVDNDNYGDVTVTMYVNSDDEVVGIFITKVAAGA